MTRKCPGCGEELEERIVEDIPHTTGHTEYDCNNHRCEIQKVQFKIAKVLELRWP